MIERRIAAHTSVFAKLVAIMATMAVSLLLLVGGFFWFIARPNLHAAIERVADEYAHSVAAASPNLETARRLGARLDLQIRYEGPDGSWSTAPDVPTIEDIRSGHVRGVTHWFGGRDYRVAPAPRGGAYLFAWNFGVRLDQAHAALLILLLWSWPRSSLPLTRSSIGCSGHCVC